MKLIALVAVLTAVALSAVGYAIADVVGTGTRVIVIGSESCSGFTPPTLGTQNVGWTVTGTLTPIPPVDPNNLLQPIQSDRTIVLSGSFTDPTGEVWNVSGTLQDNSIYFGFSDLKFSAFGQVKLKGENGDHLYGQANVRFVTGPPELDIYFTPAAPFPFVQSDGPVGITNCHTKTAT